MNNKTVFISGGASGIGLAVAKIYLNEGYHVGIFDISQDNLEESKKELTGGKVFWHTCDISNEESVNKAMQAFMAETNGRLDLLLANAGVVFMGNYEDRGLDFYQKVININTFGVLTQINAGFHILKKQRTQQ